MLRTINVSTLRNELSSLLSNLENGPILVLSQSRPKAVLMDPDMFYSLVEKVEMLEDLVDGRREISEYRTDPTSFLDAEDVFERLGHL
jgi:prevent-host-death family protein